MQQYSFLPIFIAGFVHVIFSLKNILGIGEPTANSILV
jgi:ribosomal protein S13